MRKRLLIFTNTNLLNNIWKVKQIQECFTLLMVILMRRSLLEAKKRETYKNVSHFWQWFLCTEVNCSLEEGKFRSKFGNELFFCDIYWYYWRKTLMLFMNGKTQKRVGYCIENQEKPFLWRRKRNTHEGVKNHQDISRSTKWWIVSNKTVWRLLRLHLISLYIKNLTF